MAKVLHVLALGMWFGGAGFFNFVAAPAIFASFERVVDGGPSDRTAGRVLIPADATPGEKKALASALAGAAVGPVFPRYFGIQAVCGVVALATAWAWRGCGRVHRWRVYVVGLGMVTVLVGWPISESVSGLRLHRYESADAGAAFVNWHLVSLALSFVTVTLAGVGLALAAKLPGEDPPTAVGGH